MRNLIEKAKKIIKENIYVTLGTCGKDNLPWVSPLFVSYDTELNFYWLSPKDCRHSKNISENSYSSVVLFNSQAPKWTGAGVYMAGKTYELEEKNEIEKGLKLEHERLEEPTPSYKGFVDNNPYRVYKFVPEKIWVTNDVTDENGNTIDHRAELKKPDLAKIAPPV